MMTYKNTAHDGGDAQATPVETTSAYTPTHHAKVSTLKPVKLLALGVGAHGKTATFLFAGGWQREIDITGPADAWHPLFSDLAYADGDALLEHAAIKTPLADGMVKVQKSPLSFVTCTQTKRGKHHSSDYFDVPMEHYGPGYITGEKAALELVRYVKLCGDRGAHMLFIIQAASQARGDSHIGETSRAGAAIGFLGTIAKLASWAVRNRDWEPVLLGDIAQNQRWQDKEDAQEAERAARRIKRMVSARKAKKAAQPNTEVTA